MIFAGIDAGSRTVKVVVLDGTRRKVVASGVADQGVRQADLAGRLLDKVLKKGGLRRKDIRRIVATGYGRDAISFAGTTITEITCHAAGVREQDCDARTVIDIGGQDSKVMRLDADGAVRDFVMNDRCAAGTGRFLEVVAERLRVRLDHLGALSGRTRNPVPINSTCVVFAETEIVGLLASGTAPARIAAGVQVAMAARVAVMAGRNVTTPIVFTGGVAMVPGIARALARAIGHPIRTAEQPQLTGALGAAILAAAGE
ncbi:MAG: acyl-CoA dehydratase activase [bacterium]